VKEANGRGQVAEGQRDVLQDEAAVRRTVEARLLETYRRWGYREVGTPTLELLEEVLPGAGGSDRDDLYKLIDRRGRILALRPDMTTPIARLVGTHLTEQPLPLRLCYSAPVFRYQPQGAGRPHEVLQSGVELVGASGPEADAEVIALTVEALRAGGLDSFAVSLSDSRLLPGIMKHCGVDNGVQNQLRRALADRDLVGYERAVRALSLDAERERLLLLPAGLGDAREWDSMLADLDNREAREALEAMKQVTALLERYSVTVPIHLDLGLVRGLDYYTGLIFEAFAPGSGYPVAGGGRYDRLLQAFGPDRPATGFALDVGLLLQALGRADDSGLRRPGPEVVIVAGEGQQTLAFERAQAFRRAGRSAVVWHGRPEDAQVYAEGQGSQCVALDAMGGDLSPLPPGRLRPRAGPSVAAAPAGIH